jgi:hypothetical protein
VADSVEVDPDLLRHAGCRLMDVYDQVSKVSLSLPGLVNAPGTPWGDDSYGSSFAGSDQNPGYVSNRKTLLDGLSTLTQTVQDYANGMQNAADELQGQDAWSAIKLSA